ncbi:UDP-N-acetylmuramoyl-tripeptide--D-alanyl-D-alanine ligase [Solilutibacter silvestris]|uniref:UDP-N-acetylmuramoyl-tripeptide--D-alanyl-D-alanine ligase n=1 Tax=Solilutibacter silvestris TaxID=1645665 RepID=A0A2K1Q2J7_9GAMM|nr:UDP-N-acetylmuramoyl-tripeptide--D-alanyl-D-alanine ligase [Lysobacter silvestris]PNS09278.1 murF: UDP-N-acetylmuramoyl-tripeptide--D-alanyl-D-alanine ligase [Lysobacter silvestris]
MRAQTVNEIARMCGGRVVGTGDARIDAVSTDSRALPDAQGRAVLFVALKGPSFDGHDHVVNAAAKGAVAALVSREAADVAIVQIVVADTQLALAAWAGEVQRPRTTKVAAITGSNGKTSVKSLLTSILQVHGAVYSTPGNRNNEIGLPLAVLDAPDDVPFAVYEMGAGQPGDIAYLTRIVRPDVAVVNNIAPAHLERMGSLLGVADTKAAIYDALPGDGVAVINADDAFAPYFAQRAHGRRLIRFGLDASADVVARDIRGDADGSQFHLVTPLGAAEVRLALPGRHNIANALAATALALGLGVAFDTIVRGLTAATSVGGRLVTQKLANGAVLVDDSYNANPGSTAAAIQTLAASPEQERWLVLGDMRELGPDAIALHAEAGRQAKAAGLQRLYVLGALSAEAAAAFGDGAQVFDSHDALVAALARELHGGVRVLVKGSRGSAMDRVVRALTTGERHAA